MCILQQPVSLLSDGLSAGQMCGSQGGGGAAAQRAGVLVDNMGWGVWYKVSTWDRGHFLWVLSVAKPEQAQEGTGAPSEHGSGSLQGDGHLGKLQKQRRVVTTALGAVSGGPRPAVTPRLVPVFTSARGVVGAWSLGSLQGSGVQFLFSRCLNSPLSLSNSHTRLL